MRTSLVLASLFVLAACGPAVDPRVPTITGLSGDTGRGQALFAASCASCHGTVGKGTAAGKDISTAGGRLSPTELAQIVIAGTGTMSGLPGLADQEVADVVTYVRGALK